MTKLKPEELINAVAVPHTLSEKQVNIAKRYAQEYLLDGFTINDFCSDVGISTKTWYASSFLENPDFVDYLNAIKSAIIPQDEKLAYQELKKHILKLPYKQNITPKEIDMFLEVFGYVAEADKVERMQALGISEGGKKPLSAKSIEEKKASLLSRLLAKPNKTEKEDE